MDAPVTAAGRLRAAAWPAGVTALLALAILFLGARYCRHWSAFNSDDLWAVEVSEDLLGRGYELRGWHLPYAPYLFPDLALLVVAMTFWKGLVASFLTYNFLYAGLMASVLTALFRQVGLGLRAAYLFAVSGLLLLVVTHLGAPYERRAILLFHPANHAGVLLAGLLISLLVVRNLHRPAPWPSAVLFVLAGGLGVFSDRLLLPQFLAPLCLTVGILAAFRAVRAAKVLETALLSGGAYAVAAAVTHALACCCPLLPLSVLLKEEALGASWRGFFQTLPSCVEGQYVLIGIFVAFVAAAVVVTLTFLRSARAGQGPPESAVGAGRPNVGLAALALIGLLCCAGTVAAVIVSGAGCHPDFDRYLLGAVVVPFLFAGVCWRSLPAPAQWLGRAAPAAIALFACLQMGVWQRGACSLADLERPYPDVHRVLDRLAREKTIDHGLTTYWPGRWLHYLTREHVQLRTVSSNGEPWLHTQNPNAFLSPGCGSLELPRYNFLVLTPGCNDPSHVMDRGHFERRFGTPRETVQAGPYEVWIYDGLLTTGLNLFLRSTLAPRCRAYPHVGPSWPPALARPKNNLAPKEARGTVVLPPDGEVRLVFAAPVTAELIDLGASYNAHFDILFYRGEELLAALYAPRLNVEGTFAPYCAPGNQSRLLAAPAAVRERAFTSVVVRGKGGPGCFALHHFLAYPKAPPGLKMRQSAPGGRWVYEAESQPGQVPGPAAVAHDTAASGGRARFAPRDFAGWVVHGPYAFLDRGRYRIDFFVKAEAATAGGRVAQLDVVSAGGGKPHASRDLTAADFAGGGYRKFSLALDADVDLSDCEFRVFSFAKVPLYVDRIELVCEE
jgi:hypothetical protein